MARKPLSNVVQYARMKFIVSNPTILSGTPVIRGTRIPIARVLFLLKQGYTLEDIHNEYDHVSVATLEKVIDEVEQLIGKAVHEAQTA